jgi:hypothetical protein
MSKKYYDNLKPGDVFEFYIRPISDDNSESDSDGEIIAYPNIPRQQEKIYLGREEIDGETYINWLTVNNTENFTFLYKMPEKNFFSLMERGFLKDKQGSKIPQPVLEQIRYPIPKQKEGIKELETLTNIKLPGDVKNKILTYFQPNNKDYYKNENGGSRKKYKRNLNRKSKRKTRKGKKSIITKRYNKNRNNKSKKWKMRKGGNGDETNSNKKRERTDDENQADTKKAKTELCPICHEKFESDDETITTSCNHKFHKKELIDWCIHSRRNTGDYTCPTCRKIINEEMIQYLPEQKLSDDRKSINNRNTIRIFEIRTNAAIRDISSEPLTEIPVDLRSYFNIENFFPLARESGSRQKIQNILLKLFDNDRYYNPNFGDLYSIYLYIIEINNTRRSNITSRQQATIISKIMSDIDDSQDYNDDELKEMIVNKLSNYLSLYLDSHDV